MTNPLVQALTDQAAVHITRLTELTTVLASAKGDRDKAVKAWLAAPPSDNTEAVALTEAVAKAQARLTELAEAALPTSELSEDDAAKLKTERSEVKSTLNTMFKLMEAHGADTKELRAKVPSGGGASGPRGATGPRASVWVTLTNEQGLPVEPPKWAQDDEKPKSFKGMSQAAKYLSVDTKDLQIAYAEAAGVELDKISDVSDSIEFTFKAKGGSAEFTVTTTPKPRANAS